MRVRGLTGVRARVFDVGETLVAESRIWAGAAAAHSVGIAGNQPEDSVEELAWLECECDFIASSGGWRVEKPSSIVFERVIDEAGVHAESTLYVDDRLDNDDVPARRAGTHSAHLMRGAWAHIATPRDPVVGADLHLRSLAQRQSLLD